MSINAVHLNSWSKLFVIYISKERLQLISPNGTLHLFNKEPSYVIGVEESFIVQSDFIPEFI